MTNSFIVKQKPKSYNRWKLNSEKGQNYLNSIREAFNDFNPSFEKNTEELYGIAYYFHLNSITTDADNISKPIWDCLTDFLYEDDRQIKLRIAGCFDTRKKDFEILDVSGVSGEVIAELVDAISSEEHILYIECGTLRDNMYKFNL